MTHKAYILCHFAARSSVYTSWMQNCPLPVEIVEDFSPHWTAPNDAGIVVTHMHYRWDEVGALRKIYQQNNIPILILADGILEYRNIWEHPELADGCIFQPIVGHKLATIGLGQTLVVESWGNVGKCETVGLPRFDGLLDETYPPPRPDGPFKLLIATANTPAFDQAQRDSVVAALSLIKRRFEKNGTVNGRPVELIWRLTDGLDQDIGVNAPHAQQPLSEVLDNVDSVITTASTLYLESVIRNRPTAILDFHNTPHYVQSAWMINAPRHLNEILKELASPPTAKMLFQKTTLHHQLRCEGSAANRLYELMETMTREGVTARANGRPIELPPRILPHATAGFSHVPVGFDLCEQFPNNPVFENEDVRLLQLELNLAIQRSEVLEANDLRERLARALASNGKIMDSFSDLQGRNGQLLEKIQELMERIQSLRNRNEKLRNKKIAK